MDKGERRELYREGRVVERRARISLYIEYNKVFSVFKVGFREYP